MRYALLGLLLLSMAGSCTKPKHYTCICHGQIGVDIHTLGQIPAKQAYSECQVLEQLYYDTSRYCIMEVR